MKRFFYLMLVIALPLIAEWQYPSSVNIMKPQEGWVTLYGEEGYGATPFYIGETEDGGYIVAGNKIGKLFLLKLDKNGDSAWVKQYNRGAHSIDQTSDGGYIILGNPIWLLKTDAEGDSLWAKDCELDNVSSIFSYDVKQTKDENYIIATSGVYDSSFSKGFLTKVDETGNILFIEKFNSGALCHYYNSLQVVSDSGFIITGYISTGRWSYDALLLRTDHEGKIQWHKTYGTQYDETQGLSVQLTSDSGYVIIGQLGKYYGYIWVCKTDSAGNIMWDKILGSGHEKGNWIEQTKDGGYIVTGITETDEHGLEAWIFKLKPDGQVVWENSLTFGGPDRDRDEGLCVKPTSDGGYILAVESYSFGRGKPNVMLIKLDSMWSIPLEVSATKVTFPKEGYALHNGIPNALFTNFCVPDSAEDFYYHCKIVDVNDSTSFYHDSVPGSLSSWESRWIEFKEWTAPAIADFICTFYTTGAGKCQPWTVNFSWTGIEEQPPAPSSTFELLTSFGPQVMLRFAPSINSSHVSIFDASGRKVDELVVPRTGGTVEWGDGFSQGVYFIVPETQGAVRAQKVVLIR